MDFEDDLVVSLDDEDDLINLPDDEIEEAKPAGLESSTLPGELEQEEAASGVETPAADAGEEDEPVDHGAAVRAANDRALQAELRLVAERAQSSITFVDQQMNASKVALDSLDHRIETAEQALAAAAEAGNTLDQRRLEKGIRDMESLRAQITEKRSQAPTRDQIVAQAEAEQRKIVAAAQQAPAGKAVGKNIQATTPLAERWAASNSWMKSNDKANTFVIKQSAGMVQQGWDQTTPGFYAELTRRVSQAFPALKVSALQAAKKGIAKPISRSAVAPARSASGATGAAPKASQRTYTLSPSDVAAMRRANLDPKNKVHQKHFARARLSSAAQQRSAGR